MLINGPKTILGSIPTVYAIAHRGKKTGSSQRWLQRHVSDPYVREAQERGYRARSAFKLLQVNEKRQLLRPGMRVVECGAAPGAWSQVAAEAINAGAEYKSDSPSGLLVGCDLLNIDPVPGAKLLPFSDFTSSKTQQRIRDLCGGQGVDLVLSDMAPNATGNSSHDHDAIVALVYAALKFSVTNSGKGAGFLAKIWQGSRTEKLVSDVERFYEEVRMVKPKSSRADSAEVFVLGQRFKGLKKQSDD